MLKEGDLAPELNLVGDDEKKHLLKSHRGKNIVVYFYPKDDTPGCTVEACGFRDGLNIFEMSDLIVFGISKDSTESHRRFKSKYDLNFTLLSDPDLQAYQAYGAIKDQKTVRATFLIDKQGKIAKIWPVVKVDGHVEEILEIIENQLS